MDILSMLFEELPYFWTKHLSPQAKKAKICSPSKLEPSDVGVKDYEKVTYIPLFQPEPDALDQAIADPQKNYIIVEGIAGNGKSYGVFESLRKLSKQEYCIVIPDPTSSVDDCVSYMSTHARWRRWKNKTIIFVFDDAEKFVDQEFDFDAFLSGIRKLRKYKCAKCIMTVRSEFVDSMFASTRSQHMRCIMDAWHIPLRLLTESEGKQIYNGKWDKAVQANFDGTPKSLNAKTQSRRNYFETRLTPTARKCFYIIQLFYRLRIITIPYQIVKSIAAENGIAEADCQEGIHSLIQSKYVERHDQKLYAIPYYAATLNEPPPLGIEVNDDTIVRILLSKEEYYPFANQAANTFRHISKSELAWYIFSITLLKSTSNNPLDYVAAAMEWKKKGDVDKAIEILKRGEAENLQGRHAIQTKLSELLAGEGRENEAIEALAKDFRGDKMILRNFICEVESNSGANVALIELEKKVDLLNGNQDDLIKDSVHKMYEGNEKEAIASFLQWLEAYKAEYDAAKRPLSAELKKRWSKRLTLAAAIVRIYAGACEHVDKVEVVAQFLTENFDPEQELEKNRESIYSMWYSIGYRYFKESRDTDKEKARSIWERMIREAEQPSRVYNMLSFCCYVTKDYVFACQYAEEAVKREGKRYPQNWLNYAKSYYARWKEEGKEIYLEKSLSGCREFQARLGRMPQKRQQTELSQLNDLIHKDLLPAGNNGLLDVR